MIDRKHSVLSWSIVILLISTLIGCSSEETEKPTVVSWGGKYQKSLFQNWILPAADSAGIEIRGRSYAGGYNKITQMVEQGTVRWDLVQVETFYAAKARREGWIARFNPPVDSTQFVSELRREALLTDNYAYPTIGWSYVMAWNEQALNESSDTSPPKSWSDFWDVEKYPGGRALRNTPQGNIEIALMASGMTKADIDSLLYENENLNLVDRAFKKLTELREKTDIFWWTTGNQIQRELESGSSTLAATWSGRVWVANNDPLTDQKRDVNVKLQYNQAILDFDWWIIPKGSDRVEATSRLMRSVYDHEEGAIAFARDLGYGPPISGWAEDIEGETLIDLMPTTEANSERQLRTDPQFWAKYYARLKERWDNWRAQ